MGDAGLESDVGKGAVAIVFEEMADRLVALGKAFETPAVDEEDVEPVVVVVVKEGGAAAGGFEQVFVAVLAAEDGFDVEAGLFGHVDKLDAERRAGDGGEDAFGRGARLGGVGLAGAAFGFLRGFLGVEPRRARQAEHIFER